VAEEKVRVTLDVKGKESVKDATNKVKELEKELARLQAIMDRGNTKPGGFVQSNFARVSQELKLARQEVDAQAASTVKVAAAQTKVATAAKQTAASVREAAKAQAEAAKQAEKWASVKFASAGGSTFGGKGIPGIEQQSIMVGAVSDKTRAYIKNTQEATSATNNMFGSMMRFGIALRLVSAAVNLNKKIWDEWKIVGRDIAKQIPGLQTMKSIIRDIGTAANRASVAILGWDFKGGERGVRLAQKEADAARAQRGVAAGVAMGGIRTEDDQERARRFVEAVTKEAGGGDAVRDKFIQAQIDAIPEKLRAEMVKTAGGDWVTREALAKTQAENVLAGALAGEAGAATTIGQTLGSKGITSIEKEMRSEKDAKVLEGRAAAIKSAMEGIAEPAEDAAQRTKAAYAGISDAMRRFGIFSNEARDATNRYSVAIRAEAEAKREAAAQAAAVAMAEERLARQAADAQSKKQSEQARQTARDVQIFGQGLGLEQSAAVAMQRAEARGEDTTATDARLRGQVMERLALAGVDEARRADIAGEIVGGARRGVDDFGAMRRANIAAHGPMADPELRMRMMAGGAMGRGGILAAQMSGSMGMPAEMSKLGSEALGRLRAPGGGGVGDIEKKQLEELKLIRKAFLSTRFGSPQENLLH
jgi:hypothetical protein